MCANNYLGLADNRGAGRGCQGRLRRIRFANGGLFEVMLTAEDAVISDELNHASIIDGMRLCKAKRYRYRNNDMADLRAQPGGRRRRGQDQADRHRRRVLHGRVHRQPEGHLRPGRRV